MGLSKPVQLARSSGTDCMKLVEQQKNAAIEAQSGGRK